MTNSIQTVPLTRATAEQMAARSMDFWHAEDCSSAELTEEPSRKYPGAVKVTCPGCRRFVNLYPPKAPAARPVAAPPVATRWRCRTHPDEPVTWRGKGCTACAAVTR